MCGIFLYTSKNKNNAAEIVYEGLKDLEYRGYDSWGIASLNENSVLDFQKYIGKVSETEYKKNISFLSLGHTRWATHGKVESRNTHPHLSNNKEIVVVHNGIFENYEEIKNKLKSKGYKFYSDTDTEVISVLLEDYFKKNITLLDATKAVLAKMKGANAFIVMHVPSKKVSIARNGSALHLGKKGEEFFVSSDMGAILKYTNEIYSLKDGETLSLDNVYDYKFKKLDVKNEEANIEGYKHFTIKEIFDQKKTIKNAYINSKTLSKNWYKGKKIYATGCGTAYNVTSVMTYLAAESGVDIKNFPANEYESFENLFNKNSILFVVSQSGETADALLAAKCMLKAGGKVIAIINNQNSTLVTLSDKVFPIFAGKEIAVASTKAYTAQILTFMKMLDFKLSKKELEQFEDFISADLNEKCKVVAEKYKQSKDIYVIGKGKSSPTASEIALKIKETSYIHAEGFAGGELKHGVLALIEKAVPVIVLDSEKNYSNDMESASLQVKSRGGSLIGIGPEAKTFYDNFIKIPSTKQLQFIAATIVGQILAYHFAVLNGYNPDKPRNLAKSVTVK